MQINDRVFSDFVNREFKLCEDKHKCPKLWASKFHRILNQVMRQTTIKKQLSHFPHAIFFVKLYIQYFYDHGIYQTEIHKQTRKIYRGVSKEFEVLGKEVDDKGFISMTGSLLVARDFSNKDGTIFEMKTKYLPKDVPVVYISRDVIPYSSEDEYVFLPGIFSQITSLKSESKENTHDKRCGAMYSVNKDVISEYMESSTSKSKQRGGRYSDIFQIDDFKIDFRKKIAVWYRAIKGRPIDILGHLQFPKRNKIINEEYVSAIKDIDRRYDQLPYYIPEYQDLKKIFESSTSTEEEKWDASMRMMSYNVHMALYCKETDMVLTFHSGIPGGFFNELFDIKRIPEVDKLIKETINSSFKYK